MIRLEDVTNEDPRDVFLFLFLTDEQGACVQYEGHCADCEICVWDREPIDGSVPAERLDYTRVEPRSGNCSDVWDDQVLPPHILNQKSLEALYTERLDAYPGVLYVNP